MTYLGSREAKILCSTTSTRIQKVTIVYMCSGRTPLWRSTEWGIKWGILNEPLCRLAEQSECTQELEAAFRIMGAGVMEANDDIGLVIADSLARFRKRGQISVVWVDPDGNESVVYPLPPSPV